MSVTVPVRGTSLRILVVDGRSNPFHSRLPFLAAIAQMCRVASEQGRPFDVVAGDFNTPSQSVGFDALKRQRYNLAGRATRLARNISVLSAHLRHRSCLAGPGATLAVVHVL